ncbi:hypothetical protein QEV83_17160 [Methylocapsa sp. D3K7]|nr:hypothetical protein [Methylocapsa sp. D3K7]WGJ14350.1 hypothetical protein QEV83_17160 [Methylocapsa sp. D3K7]
MSSHRQENEEPRLFADHSIEAAYLQFRQKLLWSIAWIAKIEHSLLAP